MSYEPLHHKYRPQIFADLVGQEAITTTLSNAIRTEKIASAYLFTGPRGTGKTSSARILAKSLNCVKSGKPTEQPCGACEVCRTIAKGSALDVIEVDAASNTGVDNIRELIERAQFAPVQCRYKVYVIDECHMLSVAAFNSLLKTLEEPPNRVVFVLATTDPQRVLPTIISRCQRFDFRRIPLAAMMKHLRKIANQENINITPEAVQLVAQVAQGGLRDAESLLEQLSLLSGQVVAERVWDLIGFCSEQDLIALLQAIAGNNPEQVLSCVRQIIDRGREPLTVLQNLTSFYRDLLIAKTAPDRSDLAVVTASTWNSLRELAQLCDVQTILGFTQHLAKSEDQIKNTTQPHLWLEVTLLGLLSGANGAQFGGEPAKQHSIPSHKTSVQPSEPVVSTRSHVARNHHESPPLERVSLSESAPVYREQPEPSPVSLQPVEVVQPSLEQTWQQVLAHLQPYSTQTLLRQHGCLLVFEGQQAQVGIRSQALLKIAQPGLHNIEAAFQAAFHRQVRVNLQVAASTQKSPTAKTAVKDLNAQSSNELKNTAASETTTFVPATTISAVNTPVQLTPADDVNEQNEDEVVIAAQRLADFFKGEIINVKDNLALSQPIATNNPAAPATSELYDNSPADEETDIDF